MTISPSFPPVLKLNSELEHSLSDVRFSVEFIVQQLCSKLSF